MLDRTIGKLTQRLEKTLGKDNLKMLKTLGKHTKPYVVRRVKKAINESEVPMKEAGMALVDMVDKASK